MAITDILMWAVLPYVSLVVFFGGLVWRYRVDQFGWTSRSSQWNESAILRWSSPLFHVGILLVAAGHVVGLAVPKTWTGALGVSEHVYHLMATSLGSVAAVMTILGLGGLLWRRIVVKSVRLATSRSDIVAYVGLVVVIALGTTATVSTQLLSPGGGYDYRETISVWFRSIWFLHPAVGLMTTVPLPFVLHIVAGMLLFCVWPFTRLVHVVSAPVGYVTRPPIVYRSRDVSAPERPRGW